jgi:hypothetical protein
MSCVSTAVMVSAHQRRRSRSLLDATQRRDAAWLLLVLWGVTFLVVPLMHMIGHRADHVHRAGGGVVRLVEAPHRHGDGAVHTHDAEAADAPEDPRPAPTHGADSPEHLTAALVATWSLVTVQAPSALVGEVRRAPAVRPARAPIWSSSWPRGPPAPIA